MITLLRFVMIVVRGKKAVFVFPSVEEPVACEPMLEMFRKMFIYLKTELVCTIFVKAYNKGEISEDKRRTGKGVHAKSYIM
jgi:hypothetical protein